MEDVNAIMNPEDRSIGSQVQRAEAKDFKECLNQCNLTELQTVDRDFTWTNGHVYTRIDRALVNDEWIIKMPQLQVRVMDPMFSEH